MSDPTNPFQDRSEVMSDLSKALTLQQFAQVVANLYRSEPDERVITLGDWQDSIIPGRRPVFHGVIRATVGDFRRWTSAPVEG